MRELELIYWEYENDKIDIYTLAGELKGIWNFRPTPLGGFIDYRLTICNRLISYHKGLRQAT